MRARRLFLIVTATAVLVVVAYLALLFAAHDFNPDFLAIDACLDRGGAWDYSERRCDVE